MAEGEHRIAAVIPVIDEVTAIGPLVSGLLGAGSCCVFVVDGGSTDGTRAAARAAGAVVIIEPRRGYGRACLTGADVATPDHAIVAFLDGDGSCDPADLATLVDGLDEADVAFGRRDADRCEPGALPWHARSGNALVAGIIRVRTGRTVHDLPPFKALRSAALVSLDLDDPGFGWTVQLVARSLQRRSLRVVERPVAFRCRRGGVSKVSGSWRTSVQAGRRMIGRAIAESAVRPVVAVVAKAPRDGHAKTRLAAGIGGPAALDLWRACLTDLGALLRGAARAGQVRPLSVVPAAEDIGPVAELLGPGWEVISQTRRGLGGAITDAVIAAAQRRAPAVAVISGDNPTLPLQAVTDGLAALDRASAVLGPCPDGGYYLIGVRIPTSRAGVAALVERLDRVFADAPLGGRTALEATAAALAVEGLEPALLAPWADIDTVDDLAGLAASVRSADAAAAPATRAWLAAYATLVPGRPVPRVTRATAPRSGRRSTAARRSG